MKKLSFLVMTFALIFLLGSPAQAQQFDLSAGVSGLNRPIQHCYICRPSAAAHIRLLAWIFFSTTIWESALTRLSAPSENLYQGQLPFRPFFYDVDAVYAPPLGKRAQLELSAGIGAESVRFYTPTFQCSFTGCTNFVSSNHFLGQFGAGIRLYVTPRIFIRPEAHLYLVHNNVEFSGSHATRFGVSIGYSFKNQE